MAEYIEREEVREAFRMEFDNAYADDITDRLPTANVQEVMYGKWIEKPYLLGTSNFCSLCGENFGMPHGKFSFCPNCGAKMDKE